MTSRTDHNMQSRNALNNGQINQHGRLKMKYFRMPGWGTIIEHREAGGNRHNAARQASVSTQTA